jgi:hypothetical protein
MLVAETEKRRQLIISWPLQIFSTTVYIAAALKGFYSFLSHPPDQLSAIFFRPFANLIAHSLALFGNPWNGFVVGHSA